MELNKQYMGMKKGDVNENLSYICLSDDLNHHHRPQILLVVQAHSMHSFEVLLQDHLWEPVQIQNDDYKLVDHEDEMKY